MTDPVRLHYAPDNASLCVRLTLLELAVPFETILVDRRANAQKSSAFLALNPNGLIPVLETPDGPMFETAAILLWLGDRYGQLLPAPTDPARAHGVQWMFWLSNTLHPALRMLFYPDHYVGDDTEGLRRMTRARITTQLDLLAAAKTAPWLDRDTPSVHACYLAPMLRWCALYGGDTAWFDLKRWPRLLDFATRFEIRPAAVLAAQAEGLGPTPFSKPCLPIPPEGSAL